MLLSVLLDFGVVKLEMYHTEARIATHIAMNLLAIELRSCSLVTKL